jgi:hypothetical protein
MTTTEMEKVPLVELFSPNFMAKEMEENLMEVIQLIFSANFCAEN